jgi:hypothetical protein
VNFVINGVSLSAPLTATGTPGVAQAVLLHTFTAKGNATVKVNYSANTDFGSSNATLSPSVTVYDASITTLKTSANPLLPGRSVTFTATVKSGVAGAGTPAGTVVFAIDGNNQKTVTLNASGVATWTIPANSSSLLSDGTHTITATYSGNSTFSSSSATLNQGVYYKTTTTVKSSASSSTLDDTVTFTATVKPVSPGTGVPGGTVTFMIDGVAQPAAAVVNGQATLITSSLSVGKHSVVATYDGDDPGNAYGGSKSATLTQTVYPLVVSLKASFLAPRNFGANVPFTITVQALTFNGKVSSNANFNGTISLLSSSSGGTVSGLGDGTLTFTNGVATLTGVTLSNQGKFTFEIEAAGLNTELVVNDGGKRS